MDDRAYTFEELSEMSRGSPRRSVDMMLGALQFTQLGQFDLSTFYHFLVYEINNCSYSLLISDAYKDNYVTMLDVENIRAKIIRPNLECLDGYIHVIDTVMIDDAPPWTVGGTVIIRRPPVVVIVTSLIAYLLVRH